MGKAQSKRSVDITTETKKGPEGSDEVTGKLEKIEDIDQKQVNGDATPQEKNDAAGEKKDAPDETENEKDLTTEKIAEENTAKGPTDGGDQANTTTTETSPKEDASGAAAAAVAAKEGEEISPLADESLNKKSKKKKWSFRSISFGKKDKQKPAKAEGSENSAAGATSTAENTAAATNGDASETNKPAEGADAIATKQDDLAPAVAAAEEAKPVEGEKMENGVADKEQQQMNGQKTPTPTDDAEQKKPIETLTAVVNETATVATTAVTTPAPATSNQQETANESHSEMKIAVEKIEAVVSNGTADAEKNGDVHTNEHDDQQHEEKTTAQPEDIIKSIPVDEKPHQNGTNGDEGVDEITAATKTLQIEVKTEHQIDNVNSTTNTFTTTTTIPADNFNSEQKTTSDNLLITSVQTDIHTTTNTSDKSLSSNKSIAITEEQCENHSKMVLDTVEDISKVAVEPGPAEINLIERNEATDVPQQQPPPLPLSAPPSQAIIFALKDNENNSDAISPEISTISVDNNTEHEFQTTLKELPTLPLASTSEKIEFIRTEEIIERGENLETTAEPIETTEKENSFCLSEEISVELNNLHLPGETEIVELIATVNLASRIEEEGQARGSTELLDDFAAEALIIVDQIQKDLEKEDDDSQQQETESEASLNDNVEITKNLNNIEDPITNSELLKDMVSNHEQIIVDHIQETITQSENSEASETESKIEPESALSSLSKMKDEIEVPFPMPEETNQLEIELNCKNIQLSEQEHEQRNSHQKNADQTIKKDEKIKIETVQDDKNDKDCFLKSESIEFSIDANGDNKMNVIGINENDEEFIVSSNKEIPTAKDLKENAAAAEITTQDLPVTCE